MEKQEEQKNNNRKTLEKKYNIEGHLSMRVMLNDDGNLSYSFFDDGKDAEEALEKGGELAKTPTYVCNLTDDDRKIARFALEGDDVSGKEMIELVCGPRKYTLQHKDFEDNTSLVSLTFIGIEEKEGLQSLNRIIIDNGDKKTGIRKHLNNERCGDNDHNITEAKYIGADPEATPYYIDECEICEVIGESTYSPLYRLAVKTGNEYGDTWFILNENFEVYPDGFFDFIRGEKQGFYFKKNFLRDQYFAGFIDDCEPVGMKNTGVSVSRNLDASSFGSLFIQDLKGYNADNLKKGFLKFNCSTS